jgi:serine/threonine protein kinase
MASLIGSVIAERYRIDKFVAQGGMATVYLAEDLRLDRKVAVKIIHPHLATNSSFRDKFIREAKMAARLSHPNLVNVFDQGTDGSTAYLVMEYVEGITLRNALDDFGALESIRALDLFEHLLSGLAAAHNAGVLHRDLKPENVLLANDGRIKIGDFGLARETDNHTATDSIVGTVAYLSPELVTRGIADARSDVYAAGILLFELVTGRQPFQGDQAVQVAYQHAHSNVPAPSSVNPEVKPAVDEIVLWATAKNPDDRAADAGALLAAVRRAKTALKRGDGNATMRLSTPVDSSTTVLSGAELPEPALDSKFNATQVLGSQDNATQVFGSFDVTEPTLTPLESLGQRRWGLRLVISTVLIVLLGSGAGWWFGSGPGGFSAIPDLTNRTQAEAQAALAPFGAPTSIISEPSNTISKGQVIRTEPAAGSWYFFGEIKLVISSGPKLAKVPNLVGLDVATATAKLLASGFTLGEVSSWFSAKPVGQVYEYLGSTGEQVPEGSAIKLKVSLGSIPVVAGLDQALAIGMIQGVGLKVSEITQEFSETVAKGQVISVTPITEPLGAGGEVRLLVSKGPNVVIMPAVVGETISAAKTALESLGLSVLVDTNQLQSKWGIAKVKRASVAAGTSLRSGDSVTISSK